MLDPDTFLTELYVLVDDFCKHQPRAAPTPGPARRLTTSEVVTLAIYAHITHFPSERAFYRYATRHLRAAFPGLPSRDRFTRLLPTVTATVTAFALHLGRQLALLDERRLEILDGTGLVVRNAKRRGTGWLGGEADIGWCTRLGWYEGLRLLLSVTPTGAVTGWGVGPASTNDRVLAETFFAARAADERRLPSAGIATSGDYLADMGFSGKQCQARWRLRSGAEVISPPQSDSKRAWSKAWRTWLARRRQVIETINDRLLFRFGLDRRRPHTLSGFQARLAAAIGAHNVCCWLNHRLGRGLLQVADLIDW